VSGGKTDVPVSIPDAISRMREHGIWLSDEVVRFALAHPS
jgi:hypothetical protein